MPTLRQIPASLLRIAAGVPIVCLFGGGGMLLVFGVTLRGRSVGLCAFLGGALLWLMVGFWHRAWFRRVRRPLLSALLPVLLLLYGVPALLAPDGRARGRVQSRYLRDSHAPWRLAPWNVIPEADQLSVGGCLLALMDPHMGWSRAERLRARTVAACRKMDADPDFRALQSAMGPAYADLLHLPFAAGHYFVCLPPGAADGRKRTCLVFLHGMGGNSRQYPWVLSALAQQSDCVVVAPGFGFGNWGCEAGDALAVAVTRHALATLPVDPQQVFLMGYSNGGMGITRAALRAPELYQGLIFLSPITEPELLLAPGALSHARRWRFLYLHGADDERIPRWIVKDDVEQLKRGGCQVALRMYAGEDHFLLFSQPENVIEAIGAFMNRPGLAHGEAMP
jgi:predicted esterase